MDKDQSSAITPISTTLQPSPPKTSSTLGISNYTDHLLKVYENRLRPREIPEQQAIKVSRAVSFFAFWYEKMRNAVEYREDHLIRRAAVERILKRRLMFNEQGVGIAEPLIKELLWAGYIKNGSIPETDIQIVHDIIQKYLYIRRQVYPGRPAKEQSSLDEFIVNLLSCEIEETLSPDKEMDAFVNFVYHSILTRVEFKEKQNHDHKNVLTYVATDQGFAKSDLPLIQYHLAKLLLPELTVTKGDRVETILPFFLDIYKQINWATKNHATDKLKRYIKRNSPPYMILRDIIENHPKDTRAILTNIDQLKYKVDEICRKRYQSTKAKLTRAGVRSIIYIFLTKMILAILIEYPIDRYLLKKVDFIPLAINIIFPPFLMFLLVAITNVPGADNTKRIFERILSIIQPDRSDETKYLVKSARTTKRPLLMFGFSVIYLLAFVVSFGLIIMGLREIHFNIISQLFFIFFLSMVLFFGYRIRQTAKEYLLVDKEGILSPISDFFMLPILSLGKWLSQEISRLNIFIFIFDFIIEAPFKAVFEVGEEWINFVRHKKEEII